jgi:Uncharacterized flavoproteins
MKKLLIKNNVSWVGKIDWEIRKFHGDEYSTHRGSTYNSYLIEEKTEVFKSKGIVVGSPTINRGILTAVASILEEIKGLRFTGKKAAVFGCYGWSGESTKVLSEHLEKSGFQIVSDGLKVLWNPDEEGIQLCFEFGQKLSEQLS